MPGSRVRPEKPDPFCARRPSVRIGVVRPPRGLNLVLLKGKEPSLSRRMRERVCTKQGGKGQPTAISPSPTPASPLARLLKHETFFVHHLFGSSASGGTRSGSSPRPLHTRYHPSPTAPGDEVGPDLGPASPRRKKEKKRGLTRERADIFDMTSR